MIWVTQTGTYIAKLVTCTQISAMSTVLFVELIRVAYAVCSSRVCAFDCQLSSVTDLIYRLLLTQFHLLRF